MKTAYFDCFSGVAGDMILGALIDAGMPLRHLEGELKKLNLKGYRLLRRRRKKGPHIRGTNLHVAVDREITGEYASIAKIILRSKLKSQVRDLSFSIMDRLAQAESRVHGIPVSKVHFHEVGGLDSIVDCVGAAIGFEYFGFDSISSSPLPITRGRVKCAHGLLPVPAPATMELIKGVPLEPSPIRDEIVTPTGAAILTSVTNHFGECPLQKIERVGYGFGDKTFENIPNFLRLVIGQGFPMVVVEATVDDMNPQIFEHVMERLLEIGAADVTLQHVQMKKNRPGVVLACQAPWHIKDQAIATVLRETTTLGVRYYPVDRRVMLREIKTISTRQGKVRVKVAKDDQLGIVKHIPEYEDLKRIARKKKIPLLEVYRIISKKIR